MKLKVLVILALLSAGCAGYTAKPESFLLPTSNTAIDVVLHRSDVRFLDCGTLAVIQTFDAVGKLIDAQAARGSALHCGVLNAAIEAGGRVGAAAVVRPAITKINNAVSSAVNNAVSNTNQQGQTQGQSQGQTQGQTQGQGQSQTQSSAGGAGGQGGTGIGGSGGQGGQGGNNGQGNGDGDGTNPGTDNHHDNGDTNYIGGADLHGNAANNSNGN